MLPVCANHVNLILFEPDELSRPLARSDRRAAHLLEVLRRKPGETFDAGIINGPRGKGTIIRLAERSLTLAFAWNAEQNAPSPITLIVGLPRPQTARAILRDLTTLGVEAMHFVITSRGDSNYASSTLWSSGKWRDQVICGAEQAFCTHLPAVSFGRSLKDIVAALPSAGSRLALDNYESPGPLSGSMDTVPPVTLAIGAERGWTTEERTLFRAHGFSFVHLGVRVLRTETAAIAAVTLIRAKLGLL